MNGVQLTFFNFAGYLVPGIVGVLVFLPLLYGVIPAHPFPDMIRASITSADGTISGSALAALFLPALAFLFLVGVVISDTASWIRSKIRSSGWLFYASNGGSRFALLHEQGRHEVLLQSAEARQALALQATVGWDLYGSAARARMCNACGFILTLAAPFYGFVSLYLSLFLVPFGLYLIVLGMKRHAEYWEFVDTIVFLHATGDEAPRDGP